MAVHGGPLDAALAPGAGKASLVGAALARARARPADAVMVGDRIDDVRAARGQAVRAVVAGWGHGEPEAFVDVPPDAVVGSADELRRWVATAGDARGVR